MANTIISIVTPSYNQGPFIEETIRSVLGQEGDFYLDYIIIDGASADNSPAVISQYESLLRQNCRIAEYAGLPWYVRENGDFPWHRCRGIRYRWLCEKDNGQVHALKKGFRMACGTIYGWLNSDDIYLKPGVLQEVTAYFKEDPKLELLCGDGVFISKTGQETGDHRVARINIKELLFLDYHILQPATFFSKTIYHENQLDEHYMCAFDAAFFIYHLRNGVYYKKVPASFAGFRYYEEIKTIALRKTKNREFLKIAGQYGHNIFFMMVSALYRKAEIFLHPFSNVKKGFKYKLFAAIRRLSYFLITGRWGRAV